MGRLAAVLAVAVVVVAGVAVYRLAASPLPVPPQPGEADTSSTSIWDLPHKPSDRTELLAQLETAETYWIAKRPSDYEITVSRHCYCYEDLPSVWRVSETTVGPIVERSQSMRGFIGVANLRTVGLLFSEARRLALSNLDDVAVEFDPELKYPTRIQIDPWRDSIDDEQEVVAHLRVVR